MIEILLYVILAVLIGTAGATTIISLSLLREVSRQKPRISLEMRDEIEQNAAWWDREFTRLMRKTEPLYGYSPEYIRDVEYVRNAQRRARLSIDGIAGPLTQRALSPGGYIPPCTFSWYSPTGVLRHCRHGARHAEPHRDMDDPRSWVAVGAERYTYPPPPRTDPNAFTTVLR